jgi:hypothetical protein
MSAKHSPFLKEILTKLFEERENIRKESNSSTSGDGPNRVIVNALLFELIFPIAFSSPPSLIHYI